MKQYIIARLCESSTWRAIIGLITAGCASLGLTISAELGAAIITVGMGIGSILGIFLKDDLGGKK